MADNSTITPDLASVEEIQQGWRQLGLKVANLEAEKKILEHENKDLRALLERAIEYRQKSHTELVLLLTNLVSKLPASDSGVVVAKLVEHNANVSQFLGALAKGAVEANLPQPVMLKSLDQSKRELSAAIKPLVEELVRLETPLESGLLESLAAKPDLFFSLHAVRANRCWAKGCVPLDRVVREFGPEALVFFHDRTTDAKLNPHPKPEEIALEFRPDFEAFFAQNPALVPNKRQELQTLYHRVQNSKASTDQARAQRHAFQKLSFLLELLHYYEHQETEPPQPLFAVRLPNLIEQLVIAGPRDNLDEKLIVSAENLLAFVTNPSQRQMIINNVGKGGGAGKTLKFVLRLRAEKNPDSDTDEIVAEFLRHLIPPQTVPRKETLAGILGLIPPANQLLVVKALVHFDRIPHDQAGTLAKDLAAALSLKMPIEGGNAAGGDTVQLERQRAWGKIKDLVMRRNDPAVIAAAIRERLHAKYEADEIKQSWVTLTEADPLSLIKIFCQLPYLPDGKTDPIARTLLEMNVTRLMHEKYAATYRKVVNSLKSMFTVRPDNPTLHNFIALVRWVSPEAADKLCADVGMPAMAR
jgi:hypothetical protein